MTIARDIADVIEHHIGGEIPVHVTAWDGSVAGPDAAPHVAVYSADALRRMVWHPGELGAAQAYVTGELDVLDDLDEALSHVWSVARERGLSGIRPSPRVLLDAARLALRYRLLGMPKAPPATQARVRGRLHSRARDRAAISHHYDLSNEFYELILDDHMAYSSAYWTSDAPDYTLADAQADKLDRVCRKVGLDSRPGQRFLDVGCGWGSLSLYAAEHFDANVVGVTISREQKAFIDERIAQRGLADRVEVRVQDYREIPDRPIDAVDG